MGQYDSVVTVKTIPDTSRVIKVQEGTLAGAKGDSPNNSIYNVTTVIATDPNLVLDASVATTFYIQLQNSVNISVVNWPNDSKSQRIALYFEQDATGSRTVLSWPANTKFSFGQPPVLTLAPNSVDCVVLDTFTGGQTIFGGIVGLAYS